MIDLKFNYKQNLKNWMNNLKCIKKRCNNNKEKNNFLTKHKRKKNNMFYNYKENYGKVE
jgi:hypothetical protein